MKKAIRVLVVDDSALMRMLINDMISEDPDIDVVGVAHDGKEGVAKIKEYNPDVVIMDVEMPKLNGIEAVKKVMNEHPTRIIMFTGLTDKRIAYDALEAGAIDLLLKPSGPFSIDIEKSRGDLIRMIKVVSRVDLKKISPKFVLPKTKTRFKFASSINKKIVAIGSSTGGPRALEGLFRILPNDFPATILVVQHLPKSFSRSLALRLDRNCSIPVKEAEDNEQIFPGHIYLAPSGFHMTVIKKKEPPGYFIKLDDSPPVWGVKPSVDILMESVAEIFKNRVIGVILTGMGQDGAKGVKAIKQNRGLIIAQDKGTSVVYGMPKAAVETGCVDIVTPIEEINTNLYEVLQR